MKKRLIKLFLPLCLLLLLAACITPPAPPLMLEAEAVILSPGRDANEMQISFQLAEHTGGVFVHYALVASGPQESFTPGIAAASALAGPDGSFTAVMTGLFPGRTYEYQICDDKGRTDWYSFVSATSGPSRTVFMSDTQADPDLGSYEDWGRLLAQAVSSAPDLLLLGGDLVNDRTDMDEWGRFFRAANGIFSRLPMAAAVGNHDNSHFFAPPRNGPTGFPGFYSFDYGNAHFIFLDSNLMGNAGYAPALTAWLENDLQNAETQAWKIVVQHHPYYPASESPKDEQRAETLRQFYLPILEAHGVDLILCGHQHAYTRTVPLLAGAAASGGVVQVMASSGVKHYIFEDYDYFAAGLGNTAVYVELNYDDNLFSLLAKDGEGRVVDEYEIRR